MPKNKKYKNAKKNKNQYHRGKNKLSIKKVNKKEEKVNNNMIIGIIKIEKDNDIKRVINSYERMKTNYPKNSFYNWEKIEAEGNEDEIKDRDIFINDVKNGF